MSEIFSITLYGFFFLEWRQVTIVSHLYIVPLLWYTYYKLYLECLLYTLNCVERDIEHQLKRKHAFVLLFQDNHRKLPDDHYLTTMAIAKNIEACEKSLKVLNFINVVSTIHERERLKQCYGYSVLQRRLCDLRLYISKQCDVFIQFPLSSVLQQLNYTTEWSESQNNILRLCWLSEMLVSAPWKGLWACNEEKRYKNAALSFFVCDIYLCLVQFPTMAVSISV